MKYFIQDISRLTTDNSDYRRVIHTTNYTQQVIMSLPLRVEIGNEIHGLDQFIRDERGTAKVIFNNGDEEYELKSDWAVVVPAGTFAWVAALTKTP